MLHFENDYNKGAHPALLEALVASNQEGLSGYGTDKYTESAIEKSDLLRTVLMHKLRFSRWHADQSNCHFVYVSFL